MNIPSRSTSTSRVTESKVKHEQGSPYAVCEDIASNYGFRYLLNYVLINNIKNNNNIGINNDPQLSECQRSNIKRETLTQFVETLQVWAVIFIFVVIMSLFEYVANTVKVVLKGQPDERWKSNSFNRRGWFPRSVLLECFRIVLIWIL